MANHTAGQGQQITTHSVTLTSASPRDHTAGHYVILVVMVTVILTAVAGNVCNMAVILRSLHLRHSLSNFFVVSLCTCDLLAAISVMPVAAASFWAGEWTLSGHACDVAGFATALFMFVSMTTLSVISVERYYSIRLPMHHAAHMSLHKTVVAVVLVWLWASLLAALPLFGVGDYNFHQHRYHCSLTWQEGGSRRAYVGLVVTLCFLLPFAILLVTNLGIFLVAKKAATQVRPVPEDLQRTSISTLTHPHCFSIPRSSLHAQSTKPARPSNSNPGNNTGRSDVINPTGDVNRMTSDTPDSQSHQEVSTTPNDHTTTLPPRKPSKDRGATIHKKTYPPPPPPPPPLPPPTTQHVPNSNNVIFTEDSGIVLSHAEEENSANTIDLTTSRTVNPPPPPPHYHHHHHQKSPGKGYYKAAKTLMIFLAAYTFLWAPYFILHLHGVIHDHVEAPQTTELVVLWLSFASFAVNPFLYGWMNKAIREELVSLYKTVFCRCPCCPRALDPEGDLADGPSGEDFLQFLERTSQAPTSVSTRKTRNHQSQAEEDHHRPDLSDVNIESSGPF